MISGDARPQPVDVQVFLGMSELGGVLWEQEVRALTRIAGLRHPALPQLLGGGYEDSAATEEAGVATDGVAFVCTEGADFTLADDGAEHFRANPKEGLRQFVALADGLALLHDMGMAHRNLWPATVDTVQDEGQPPTLRLARFELSSFVAGLLSGVSVDSADSHGEVRALVLGQGVGCLPYAAPERVDFLFGDWAEQGAKADVYSLGAIVWEWFVGPFPTALLPTELGPDTRERLTSLQEEMRRRLHDAELAPALRDLLLNMLDPQPEQRPTSTEVVNKLTRTHDANMAFYGAATSDQPYLVAYMPTYSRKTLLNWGLLDQDPTTEAGAQELRELISTDLRRGYILHSPHGADPFVVGGAAAQKREATTVLLGSQVLWFCQLFRARQSAFGGGLGPSMDEVLLIKYVAQRDNPKVRHQLQELQRPGICRAMPELTPIDYGTDRVSLRPGRAAIDELCSSVVGVGDVGVDRQVCRI